MKIQNSSTYYGNCLSLELAQRYRKVAQSDAPAKSHSRKQRAHQEALAIGHLANALRHETEKGRFDIFA